ncbi:RNA polymerase sigma factor [Steroidobacter sp.]|uniref:RNA polymerase sigma factor n=1 Tax=Steroidobacter sp. TaxID=1978227 RepID=UPI001A5034BF|nr:RNA polymerase sigma factor [Steroidobacter sp.]MBL8265906.1 RNA polymerase sigma factor [Steroidobacter sp.]
MSSKPESPPDPTATVPEGANDAPIPAEHHVLVRQLFREHNRALVNFLRARVASEQEAQDVAQEAYVKLLQLHEPGAIGFLRGYLFRIATNLTVDRARQRGVRHRFVQEKADAGWLDNPIGMDPPEALATNRQQFDLACQALNELPPKPRQAFVRHVVEGYSPREVALELGVDERTVRKFITRALLHCRRSMQVSPEQGE